MALLELNNITFSYGAFTVMDDVTVSVQSGDALGIIGPNGAGKTTLIDLMMGTKLPRSGTIKFEGQDISRLGPAQRCRLGIARSFQIPHPFEGMSVFENILVGATLGGNGIETKAYKTAFEALELSNLETLANQKAGNIRLLDRKRLELARALATRPKILLLDEVAGGLSDVECSSLIETILQIHAAGTTIVWIEHIVHALTAVVSKLMVIDQGRKLTLGKPQEVLATRAVQEIYLGMPA